MATRAKPTVIEGLYRLLLDDPDLPVELQQRIYTYSQRHQRRSLLTRLATHRNLDPALDTAFGTASRAEVVAAWLSRPDRTDAEVLSFAGDRRGAVQEALATKFGLTSEIYHQLASARSQAALKAVVSNPAAPLTARQAAAANLGARLTTHGYSAEYRLARTFDVQPLVHDALASRTTNHTVASYVASSPLSSASATQVVDVTIQHVLDDIAAGANQRSYSNIRNLTLVTRLAKNPSVGKAARGRLHALLVEHDEHFIRTQNRSGYDTALQALMHLPPSKDSSRLKAAATTTSPEKLNQLADHATSAKDAELAGSILFNRFVSASTAGRLWNLCPRATHDIVLRGHLDHPDVFATLGSRWTHEVTDSLLALSSDPSATLVTVIRHLAVRGSLPKHLAASRFFTPDVARSCTVAQLAANAGTSLTASRAVASALVGEIESDSAWATFEALAANVELPLEELAAGTRLLDAS